MGVTGEAPRETGPALEARSAGRVRVAIVAPTLGIVGGQSVQAAWLIDRLRSEPGLDVELLPVNPTLAPPFGWLQRAKYVRTLVTETWYLWTLVRRLHRYDVAHIFSASYFSFVLAPMPAILLGRLFGKKVILNYHSGEADDHLRRWRRSAVPVMRLAHRIVVPSGYLVDVFARHGLTAEAVPNFVQGSHARYRPRERPAPTFLANRNLEPMYDVAAVLRAFGLVQARHSDARLMVAGDGSERKRLERMTEELGLRDVEFLGQITPNEMGELYDRADIYLNASRIDNMPLSILESFGAGLPVVTTAAGGIPYIARHEDNALVVEPGDPESLAAAAIRLLEEPSLAAEVGARARAEFEQRYTWQAVSAGWLELYRELAGGGRAGSVPATRDAG